MSVAANDQLDAVLLDAVLRYASAPERSSPVALAWFREQVEAFPPAWRLRMFEALPERVQEEAWRHLAEQAHEKWDAA